MNKIVAIAIAAIVLTGLACSIGRSEEGRDIWLSGYLLLRIRTAAGGYSIEERVNALQLRANNLLQLGKGIPTITIRKSGKDANIYSNDTLFITVTSADARANGTTVGKLAVIWANRLRTILPKASPEKPGVGLPGEPE